MGLYATQPLQIDLFNGLDCYWDFLHWAKLQLDELLYRQCARKPYKLYVICMYVLLPQKSHQFAFLLFIKRG